MGGWITIFGSISDFDGRLSRFRKMFSVEGMPSIRTEINEYSEDFRTVSWSWNCNEVPDVQCKKKGDNDVLVLCGVVTDLGRFGLLSSGQDLIAESILGLWIEHGDKIIREINGSFSCLFYKHREKTAHLYTDRFASRSIWMAEEKGVYIIGNFPSAIAAMLKNSPKIDAVGLYSLLNAGRHVGTRGLYHGINILLAGQNAVLALGSRAQISRWHNKRYKPDMRLSTYEWGRRLADAIKDSAARYKRVCKSAHLFLSGGLDSRIVAASFQRPLKTLTLCTFPNMESYIASLVSKVIGLENQRIVRSPYWYLENIEVSALLGSGNFHNHHGHFITPVRRVCSEDTVAEFMLGDLMENFNKHYFSVHNSQDAVYSPKTIKSFLYAHVPYTIKDLQRMGFHFTRGLRNIIEEKYTQVLREYAESLIEVSEDHADRFDTFLRWNDISSTPTYNMISSIWPLAKERNIRLDNELDELSLRIPSHLRGAGILHSWTLFHLNKRLILIPDTNTFLPPFFPSSLKQTAKKIRPSIGRLRRRLLRKDSSEPVLKTSGSWLLLHEMYRKDCHYRQYIENIFTDKNIFPPEIFNLVNIKKTWDEYQKGNINLDFEIEGLLSFGTLNKKTSFSGLEL